MMCTLATLLSCFHLSGFYIDSALIHSDAGEGHFADQSTKPNDSTPWYTTDQRTFHKWTFEPQNPYVRIAIGYDVQWSARWSTRLDYSHESSIATSRDRGAERLTLGLTWRPFTH